MKIKLVLRPGEFTSFTSYYLEEFWREYFDIQWYDSTQTYQQADTVFVVWWDNANSVWAQRMQDQGYHVAVDNLWETATGNINGYWLENSNWFWYNESLWWTALGYNDFQPSPNPTLLAFMPIRRKAPIRDHIVDRLHSVLNSMLWSYHNKPLPNDTTDPDQGQRYYHPDWYNQTYSSLVVETKQHGSMFITEKTFKPMAFYHPFQIIGVPGTLTELRKLGFETFDNLFDESYDSIEDIGTRIDKIINNLQQIKLIPYDNLTIEKLHHNQARFFDVNLVKQRMVTEIIEPLLEYAHKTL
jgi:hypothetical protein